MNDTRLQRPNETAVVPPLAEAPKKRKGFAAMDREEVRELARRGGAAAHRAGTAHEFTSEEARAAGRKGGFKAQEKRRESGQS